MVFAGGIVVVSVLGLAVAGVPFMTAGGIALALMVAVMVAVSVTLLPALLGLSGHAINRFGFRRSGTRGRRPLVALDHPRHALLVGLRHRRRSPLLVALAAPVLALRPGIPDDGTLPTSRTERQAYDLVAQGFGPGRNGPFVVAVDTASDTTRCRRLVDALSPATAGSRRWRSRRPRERPPASSPSSSFPTTGPQDEATRDTVERLRAEVIPAALQGSPAQAPTSAVRW